MKIVLFVTVFLGAAFPTGAAEKFMQERYNVGGYINVGPTTPYRFASHPNPRALPAASDQKLNLHGNAKAIANAKTFMKKFPETTGMMLIDHGKIIFEAYQGRGNEFSEFYGMSISKSMASLAVGKALCNGVLKSLNTLAGKFVPELKINRYGESTIRQLLMMSSGAYLSIRSGQPKFTDGIGKIRRTGKPYKTGPWPLRLGQVTVSDLLWGPAWAKIKNKNHAKPGQIFAYKSGDTLALSKVIERASGMSLAAYFDKYIWQEVRPGRAGHWETDLDGTTRGNAGFQASLKDWGRIAVWLSAQLKKPGCFGDYRRDATSTQIKNNRRGSGFDGYGYQWWTDHRNTPGFWGKGYAGQELGINPETEKILIKFGYRTDTNVAISISRLFREWHKTN